MPIRNRPFDPAKHVCHDLRQAMSARPSRRKLLQHDGGSMHANSDSGCPEPQINMYPGSAPTPARIAPVSHLKSFLTSDTPAIDQSILYQDLPLSLPLVHPQHRRCGQRWGWSESCKMQEFDSKELTGSPAMHRAAIETAQTPFSLRPSCNPLKSLQISVRIAAASMSLDIYPCA